MSIATATVILDKRIQKNDGTYAIKLKVTYNRLQKYYPLNYHFSIEEWERIQAKNPRKELREMKIYFNKLETKANQVIKDLPQFPLLNFEKAYNQNEIKNDDLFTFLKGFVARMVIDGIKKSVLPVCNFH